MKRVKRFISICLIIAILASICIISTVVSGASGTGAGLAEWALNAYYSGWSYVYGGSSPGAVDCSGLIYSYAGGYRTGNAQIDNASYVGYVSNGVPRIHGLGLFKPGHVGVYVGDEMAVDARGDEYGVCYESVYSHNWTRYFKVPGVSYPSNGWVKFNGSSYYYENGQYIVNTTRTIDGVTYSFSSSGKASKGGTASESQSSASVSTSTSTTATGSSTAQSSTLKKGSTGSAVEKMQQRLYDLGYYTGSVDGDFGKNTEDAFKLFQKQAGLYVDGIAGNDLDVLYSDDTPKYVAEESTDTKEADDDNQATELAIAKKSDSETAQTGANNEDADDKESEEEEEETPTSFEKGDTNDKIAEIQQRLNELGYYEGKSDGSFGSVTEEAVSTFQGANGITQTGIADEVTIDVLFSDKAKENPLKNNAVESSEVVSSEIPQSAMLNLSNQALPTEASVTEVELQTSKLSSKALAGIANDIGFEEDSNGNNFQFILWLGIMIIVMTIAFILVRAIEKKKTNKNTSRKYF